MDWEALYQEYEVALRNRQSPRRWEIERLVRTHLPNRKLGGIEWALSALKDERRKWFVGRPFLGSGQLPRRLIDPFLRAGIYSQDASNNRTFIEPCLRTVGLRYVRAFVQGYLETGTEAEKEGASPALYWAQPRFGENIPE
jgi:hypothetical protein